MKIVITEPRKAEILQCLMELIGSISPMTSIHLNSDGLFIQSMDNSRISVTEIKIPPAWFVGSSGGGKFEVDTPVNIGVHPSNLGRILKDRLTEQTVILEIAEETEDCLNISFVSPPTVAVGQEEEPKTSRKPVKAKRAECSRNYITEYQLHLLDIEADVLETPKEDNSRADFVLESVQFAQWINQLRHFSDTCDFECSEDKIVLKSTSTDSGSMSISIPIDDLVEFQIEENATILLSFSLKHMATMAQLTKISSKVHLFISPDEPIRALYYLGDDTTATLDFYLAPKISDEN
jgi:hypothetical protein